MSQRDAARVTIRPATLDDAEAIGIVHVAAWQAAYRGTMPDEFLDTLRAADRAAGARRTIEALGDHARMLVAVLDPGDPDHEVVGFVSFGNDRDTVAPLDGAGGPGELYAVNLAPPTWGRGIGRALVRAAADGLRELGHGDAVLWVVPENARARGLYESEGWRADGGARSFELFGTTVPEVRYRRSLTTG